MDIVSMTREATTVSAETDSNLVRMENLAKVQYSLISNYVDKFQIIIYKLIM